MVTLTQLSYLIAIDRYGSFREAAKHCFVTQPTLSMQVQKLEEFLDITVFDRSKQPITATPAGRSIVEQAKIVLRESAKIEEIIKESRGEVEGTLRLGVIPTIAPYLLPRFTRKFIEDYPKAQLIIEECKTEDIIEGLRNNKFDLGLLVTPLEEQDIREIPIVNEKFYVYSNDDSFHNKELLNPNQLPVENMLLLSEGHRMREQMLNLCQLKSEFRKQNQTLFFESGSIETLVNMVDAGHGFTIIPYLAAFHAQKRQGQVLAFAGPVPVREISLVTHKSSIRTAATQAL